MAVTGCTSLLLRTEDTPRVEGQFLSLGSLVPFMGTNAGGFMLSSLHDYKHLGFCKECIPSHIHKSLRLE